MGCQKHFNRQWAGFWGISAIIIGEAVWYLISNPVFGFPFVALGVWLIILDSSSKSLEFGQSNPTQNNGRDSIDFSYNWLPVGLFLIGLVLVGLASWYSIQDSQTVLYYPLLIWIVGICLVLLSLVPVGEYRAILQEISEIPKLRSKVLVVFLLMSIGLLIRLAWLGTFPDMMAEDEGYFANQGAEILSVHNWRVNPFSLTFDGHPLFYHLFEATSIDLLGQSVFAARFPSAIIGAFTIGGVFLLGHCMFNARIGFIASTFVTFFPQHIHFSRLALNQVMDSFTISFTFVFLILALHRRDRLWFGLAGLMLGFSQYGYSSSRLIPLLAGLYVLWFWLLGQAKFRKRDLISLGILLIMFVVVVLPQGIFLATHSGSLTPRLDTISIWNENNRIGIVSSNGTNSFDFWSRQISYPFLGFIQRNDEGYFYGRFNPFLGWLAAIPFLVGLAVALRHLRNEYAFILVVSWVLVAILGGVLVSNPPEFQRFVIAIPSVALLAALGIVCTSDSVIWLSRRLTPNEPVPQIISDWILPIILVLLLGTIDLKTYAVDYRLARPYFRGSRTTNLNIVADQVLPIYKEYRIWYLEARDLNLGTSPILKYKAPGAKTHNYIEDIEELPQVVNAYLDDGEPQIVILAPHYPQFDTAHALLSNMVNVKIWAVPDPYTNTLVAYVFILNN